MGPLNGIKIVEIGSIGPGPMCAMLLSDLGADVLRIDRADSVGGQPGPVPPRYMLLHRGRRSVALDLKKPDAGRRRRNRRPGSGAGPACPWCRCRPARR